MPITFQPVELEPTMDDAELATHLLSAQAVRSHSQAVLALAEADEARHFTLHPERMDVVAAYVLQVIRDRYPDLKVPYHSRWRHFEAGGADRWGLVADSTGLAAPHKRLERARARVDLAITSVLLDAGAGPTWTYQDAPSGQSLSRSEGLGVASLRWWAAGGLSSDPHHPAQADAQGLVLVKASALAQAFQASPDNPLVGVEGRASLLQQLGQALKLHPQVYGRLAPRPPGRHLAGAQPQWPGQRTQGAGRAAADLGQHLAGPP